MLFVIYDTANRYEGISERTDEKSLRKGVISWPDESVRSLSVVFFHGLDTCVLLYFYVLCIASRFAFTVTSLPNQTLS